MTASELQRNAHVLVLQEMRDRFTEAGIPSRTAALDAAISALAARQPVGQEPITVEAVATIFDHPEYGLSLHWLLENGIGELQVGDVLMVSDRSITDDDGSGEVYAVPPAQAVDLPYSLDADPAGIRDRVCDAITGTLMVGAQGHTPPPAGHWAEPFWKAARADAAAQAVAMGTVCAALDAAQGLAVVCASVDGYSREEVAASGQAMRQQFADARAMIDSQAVRNG